MATSSVEQDYPQLLSLAVHEFRTPVSVVGGYLRMLHRDTEEPLTPRQRKLVEEAEKSCDRLVALIAEMSELGKLDAGLIVLAREPIDLISMLNDLAEHVQEGRDRDVQFVLRSDVAAAPIAGDAVRLRSAFEAVFRAVLREKAGPATVAADCRRAAIDGRDCGVVVVADTTTVQEAYERPRGVFNEQRGGLGLALPLARRVFEGHGGQIWSPQPVAGRSESEDPVSRASLIVALPITEQNT
jgi:signal transduction histidine kinase